MVICPKWQHAGMTLACLPIHPHFPLAGLWRRGHWRNSRWSKILHLACVKQWQKRIPNIPGDQVLCFWCHDCLLPNLRRVLKSEWCGLGRRMLCSRHRWSFRYAVPKPIESFQVNTSPFYWQPEWLGQDWSDRLLTTHSNQQDGCSILYQLKCLNIYSGHPHIDHVLVI